MPGWHEATKELQQQGKVRMVGIIEEQHPDRCRLFMQWKQMGWPILVDSLNRLKVPYVPITLAIDEYGIIRAINMRVAQAKTVEEEFLNRTFEKPTASPDAKTPDLKALKAATKQNTAEAWESYAQAVFLWGGESRIGEAIEAYQRALKIEPGNGWMHFRQGVAYRQRYDSRQRQTDDFQQAVEHWSKALDIDPNQYIWRRRIQQYGPRLDKPYPFYDWVITARDEIQARGQTPLPLMVEPGGAEFTKPLKNFTTAEAPQEEPDPQGRIHRDQSRFIEIETTLAPPAVAPGGSTRVHLVFRPNERIKAHWNNEVDPMVVRVNPPEGWMVDNSYLTTPNPPAAVSKETRKIEFELRAPEPAKIGSVTIPGYALYYVCEDINGTCLYRRQDLNIRLTVRASTP